MNAYIFVAAAIISVISLIVIFKRSVNKLIESPNSLAQVQKNFLIYIALSKIVPVILLIFGMIKMTAMDLKDLYIPIAIIVITVIYGFISISSQKKVKTDENVSYSIHVLSVMARPLIFSIPLMAIVFLLMMTQ